MTSNLFLLRTKVNDEGYDRGYPIDQWNAQATLYSEHLEHFSGQWLEETISETNFNKKYPLQYDPCVLPVMLHNSFLYGEVPDGAAALVQPQVEIWNGGEKSTNAADTKAAEKMTNFLRSIWDENGARAKQLQVGLDSQVFGGFVLGTFYDPERELLDGEIPISILRFDPADFFPVWRASDPDRLIDVQIAYGITSIQAEELGVKIENNIALYREQWTRGEYEITIDDKVVTIYGNPGEGKTPASVIPFVYVPHPPRIGFYGTSLLRRKLSQAKEINDTIVNTGDIIAEEALNIPAIRNVREPKITRLSGTKPVINLGFQQGDRIPDIIYPPQRGSSVSSATEHTESLVSRLRGEMYCSPVLFGESDGSQRSAASLQLQAIPMVAHIRMERALCDAGMARINKNILRIAAAKGVGGITPVMARKARLKSNWFPMMPRDVLEEVMSLISRVQSSTLSPETAIDKMGDVLDIPAELAKIEAWQEKQREQQVKTTNETNAYANTGRSGELGGRQTTQPKK